LIHRGLHRVKVKQSKGGKLGEKLQAEVTKRDGVI